MPGPGEDAVQVSSPVSHWQLVPDLTLLEPEIRELQPGEARSIAAPKIPGPEDDAVQVSSPVCPTRPDAAH